MLETVIRAARSYLTGMSLLRNGDHRCLLTAAAIAGTAVVYILVQQQFVKNAVVVIRWFSLVFSSSPTAILDDLLRQIVCYCDVTKVSKGRISPYSVL